MDGFVAGGSQLLGGAWPVVWTLAKIVAVLVPILLCVAYLTYWERKMMGANEDTMLTEDIPPSFAESWRIVWSVRTLRRIFYSLPFLARPQSRCPRTAHKRLAASE